jgi:hypothetical protein
MSVFWVMVWGGEQSDEECMSQGTVRTKSASNLLNASDLAKLCDVDLKTIHNWCNRGKLDHFRTPGRHLRFFVTRTIAFLQKHGYAVPADLLAQAEELPVEAPAVKPLRICVVSENEYDAADLRSRVGEGMEVVFFRDPLIGISRSLGAFGDRADILVLVPPLRKFSCPGMTRRLRDANATVKTINYGIGEPATKPTMAGCTKDVEYGDVEGLVKAIERLAKRI